MLNPETKERELAYVVKVDEVRPIEGKDRVECAVVGGWTCMVPKDAFQAGSLGIYFEIDSKVDTNKPEFAFTAKYNGKIKTQKFAVKDENGNKIGQFFSQGLLMSPADFGWEIMAYDKGIDMKNGTILLEGDFLTKELGVTYAEAEDNKRKAKSDPNAKYKSMMSRHPKLAKSKFGRWAMKHMFMKKILYFFLGRKSDKKREWPSWVVKTDEERIQNLVSRIPEFTQEVWVATEKVDGTSTTFTLKRNKKNFDYFVCSRNVVMNQPGKEKTCYYAETDGNVYVEMSNKYNMEEVLKDILLFEIPSCEFITVQGETYGGSIQKRDYSTKEHNLAVFNVIFGYKDGRTIRLNPYEMTALMDQYNIPCVPIIGLVEIPDTCEEILTMAHGDSAIDGLPREGIVFRTKDGERSFKAVDNEFLVKYHG